MTTNKTNTTTKSTKSTNKKVVNKVNNNEKTNKNYNDIYKVLTETIANKNALTLELNKIGVYANMKSKNTTDFTTVNNDLYFQLYDGTRLFFGTNRKKIQLWLTNDLYENREKIGVFKNITFTPCNDSLRKYNSAKNIEFTVEWFNEFMTDYNKLYAVRFTDLNNNK